MKTDIFTDFDKRMGIIPRWTIVHTIQKQSVAEHCFNVERIATRIAKQWFYIGDTETLYRISQWALHHDDLEAATGDIQSPVKPLFDEARAEELYPEIRVQHPSDRIKHIVKLADLIEWLIFAAYEMQLGNKFIEDFFNYHCQHVVAYAEKLSFNTGDHDPPWFNAGIVTRIKDFVFQIKSHPPKLMDFGRRM